MRAQTPAGLYAKAALLVTSQGARALALSLAADLVDNAVLRRVLWPVAAAASGEASA
jgi:hypothetical protein